MVHGSFLATRGMLDGRTKPWQSKEKHSTPAEDCAHADASYCSEFAVWHRFPLGATLRHTLWVTANDATFNSDARR